MVVEIRTLIWSTLSKHCQVAKFGAITFMTKATYVIPWTVNIVVDFAFPRAFIAWQTYMPASVSWVFVIINVPLLCVAWRPEGRVPSTRNQVISGTGRPIALHCSETVSTILTVSTTPGVAIVGMDTETPCSPNRKIDSDVKSPTNWYLNE